MFFAMWVQKEAYLKGLGMGLSVPPAEVDLGSDADAADQIVTIKQPGASCTWTIRHFAPGHGFAGAFALAGPIIATRCFEAAQLPTVHGEFIIAVS